MNIFEIIQQTYQKEKINEIDDCIKRLFEYLITISYICDMDITQKIELNKIIKKYTTDIFILSYIRRLLPRLLFY